MKTITCFIRSSILTLSIFSTASATVLINEIDYDQDGTDTAGFIELFNSGPGSINLANYRLDLINGATTTVYRSFDLTGYSLAADSYFMICANASMVMNCDVDAGILSIGRLPGSQDTSDNAADFEHGCITPGTTNISGSVIS
ncbi:MAG: lamin tail domain-containing protein [Candidatus Polarisedimenticolaceae bacterium]|nr:lamin tail domain-containing protein [Candidatus Polarisedimenticolaceae bacterium]